MSSLPSTLAQEVPLHPLLTHRTRLGEHLSLATGLRTAPTHRAVVG